MKMDNFSPEHIKYLKNERRKKVLKISLQIAIFILFFALWELLTFFDIINPFIFSSPSRAIKMSGTLIKTGLFRHIGITLFETILGFLLGSFLGFIVAVFLWWSPMARAVIDP